VSYNDRIMDAKELLSQLEQVMKFNEELREQNASLVQLNEQVRDENSALRRELQTLRHDHEALLASTQTLIEDRDKLQRRVDELETVNRRLVDMLWGRRSERRVPSPDQLSLDFGDDPPSTDEEQAVIMAQLQADAALDEQFVCDTMARRRRRRERRRQTQEFPEHIERRERILDLSDEEKVGLTRIGEAVSERMCFENPYAYIERIVRPKYVKKDQPQRGVIAQPPPLSIVEGCKYDFGVITAILAQKFAFHCPTYRQQDWFAQCGWSPSRSTINDLINASVDVLTPLFDQMWHVLRQQPILLTDDTRVLLLTRGALSREQLESLKGRRRSGTPPGDEPPELDDRGSVTSYAWLYTGLDSLAPYNVFHWSLTHQHSVVDEHLAEYQGVLVGDAYSGYTQIEKRSDGRIEHASCNGHARREFVRAEVSEPILCAEALSLYRQLYDVEERGKLLSVAGRFELRQRDAIPIWERFGRWLESEKVRRALPKSDFGKAVGYLRNQWTGLRRYLSDGRIPFDNSQSEQEIRPLTVGRSNWKFLGHPRAAAGRLQLVSIASSAVRNHLIVHDYLEDVLRKLADAAQHHPDQLAMGSEYLLKLLPDRWAATHPQSVRRERIEEKKQVAEAKRLRRARRRLLARRKAEASR
jgi:transposase